MRLSKIYTKTGDKGETHLAQGKRVPKISQRIKVIGEVDELNAHIGVLHAENLNDWQSERLRQIMNRLFDLGGELSMVDVSFFSATDVVELESFIDDMNEKLEPLKEFILPSGSRSLALCHLARTVCRRVEREMWILDSAEMVNAYSLKYINRLSDFLFVLVRDIARRNNIAEVYWQAQQNNG